MAASKEELAETKDAIKAAQIKQEELLKQQKEIEKNLLDLQEKLVEVTENYRESEQEVFRLKQEINQLDKDLAAKEKKLASQKEKLDGLSRIAIRLSRTPPQAMVLMPEEGKERIQAARALSIITSELKTLSEKLKQDMETIHELKETSEEKKLRAEKINAQYRGQKKRFETLINERTQLNKTLAASYQQEKDKVASLAKKANSLQDLLTRLVQREEEKKQQRQKAEAEKPSGEYVKSPQGMEGRRGKLRSMANAKGKLRVPVSGHVISHYGDTDQAKGKHKGIKIDADDGAIVIAPFDAEVAYSGKFLNYGKLVILKHRGDYHTLLAGLQRIDVATGDFLLEGEPIGAMGNGKASRLYVELRQHNQPVNPKSWIRGL